MIVCNLEITTNILSLVRRGRLCFWIFEQAWCPLCASIFAFPCSQPLLMAHKKIVFAATATRKFFVNFVTTVIDIFYQVVFVAGL